MASRPRKMRPSWRLVAAGALLGLIGWFGYEWVRLPDARGLLTKNPPSTALIDHRAAEARAQGRKPRRRQQWVPLTAISPQLVESVLASEDSRFFQHHGVDTEEVNNALKDAWRRGELGRGASTVTQQLAKNLWLSGDRSLLRKLKELVLTERLESALNKPRILSLYLNVAEWGDGVYGAEAAAQEHFGISAAQLDAAEGAILAAMLPAPLRRTPTSHSPALKKRAEWILDRRVDAGKLSSDDASTARAEIERILAGPKPAEPEPEDDVEADP